MEILAAIKTMKDKQLDNGAFKNEMEVMRIWNSKTINMMKIVME